MIPDRRSTRAPGAAALAAALLALPILAAAQSVQISVNTAFVAFARGGTPPNCRSVTSGGALQFVCDIPTSVPTPQNGYISNDPQINFSNAAEAAVCDGAALTLNAGDHRRNVCNNQVFFCAQVVGTAPSGTAVGIDQIEFELFKFQNGSNPLDPASTPPLRTYFVDGPGVIAGAGSTPQYVPSDTTASCVLWDGSYNIQGLFGRTNGEFGFRVTVQTNQSGTSAGNVTITQTRAYPTGTTGDVNGVSVVQKPVTVDVSDVHAVVSSPTVVGQITGVAAEPYNLAYRLSRDATTYITINQSASPFGTLRSVVPGLPRVGEGVPAGTLTNGDSWDGRDNNGNMLPPGNYLAVFQALSSNEYGADLSQSTTYQIALDPLQITDLRVSPLSGGSTSLAVLSYQLTEPATVYLDIYPPGTQFCPGAGDQGLNDVNNAAHDPAFAGAIPGKSFGARQGSCATGAVVQPLREVVQQQAARQSVLSFWDGRDASGILVGDGDYVFVIYASLPSQAGTAYVASALDRRVWTSTAKTGFLSVLRGLVGITQVTPTSIVVGSSPAVAGLNPFTFRYQLSREAVVSMKIFDATGGTVVKTLINQETRPGSLGLSETWSDATDDNGRTVSSGTYLVQLTATDPAFPAKVSTTTALFPVHLFRITDVAVSPLLSGASEQVTLNYQLSQTMFTAWNVYPPGSVVVASSATWPPCPAQSPPNACTSASVLTPAGAPASPVITFRGLRPGRLRISEFWDGRDPNGIFVPDGNYVFTLTAQSTTTPQQFASDRVYGTLTIARGAIVFTSFSVAPTVPTLFNSSNTITLDPFTIAYTVTRQSSVTVQILSTSLPPQVVRTLVAGAVRDASVLQNEVWDGKDDRGNFPPAGFYTVRTVAQDVASALSSGSTAQTTVSYDPLRIYDLAVTPLRSDNPSAIISYQVSEPMRVAIKIYRPGTTFDAAGNPSTPDAQSLVQRIVGLRPGRTQIQDFWDGRDLKRALQPDGNYKFKIVASTDPAALDSITGDILIPGELAADRLIDDLPVAVNGSVDPGADFETNTFVYPNPVSGPSGTFQIYAPFQANVTLRLYTLSGTLVFTRDFGSVPPAFQSGPVSFVWSKVNQSGRRVGRGLYYALIRADATDGSGNILQTVKKVLVP
ncbi:MAG: hypothetical protein HY552_03180 [Elusimicrobia bacterium]|nr:hypothetical protein [Elusimicrobiota bacterium]